MMTYAAGLAFNLAYLVLEGALVGWIFNTVELALALGVIAAKLWLERGGRGKRDAEDRKEYAEHVKEEREEEEEEEEEEEAKDKTGAAAAAAAAKESATGRTTTIAETRV